MSRQKRLFPNGTVGLAVATIGLLLCGSILSPTIAANECPSGCTKPGGNVRIGSASGVQVGDEFTIEIALSDITDMYGVELEMAFNPTVLQVKDAKQGTVGIQIEPGDLPNPQQGFSVQNAADNIAGTIAYAVSLLNPSPPASGSGTLARIHFQAIAPGTSSIRIIHLVIVASDSCCLELTTEEGLVSVTTTGGTVSGRVLLQGRANHGGVTVSVAGRSATTATDGSFSIAGVPAGTYTVTASFATYLDAERSSVVVTSGGAASLPDAELLAGDVDDNCAINIFDLVILGTVYGTSPPGDARVDFNQDNQVNLFDLVLLAGNYGRSCPGPW